MLFFLVRCYLDGIKRGLYAGFAEALDKLRDMQGGTTTLGDAWLHTWLFSHGLEIQLKIVEPEHRGQRQVCLRNVISSSCCKAQHAFSVAK